MGSRRTGRLSTAYLGVNPPTPPDSIEADRAPTPRDYSDYNLGDQWLDRTTNNIWVLVSKDLGDAVWKLFSPGGSGILTITGDSGGAVPGDGMDNINILGTTGEVTTTGDIPTNTLTFDLGETVALSFPTDSGTAIPAGGELNIFGGAGITTSGAGNTVTVTLDTIVPLQFNADTDYAVVINNMVNWLGDGTFVSTVGDTGDTLTINMDAGVANEYVTNAGTAVPSGGILEVLGGDNINTTGSGNTVTVILDTSILQPSTTTDSLNGVYALGSTDYETDRFLYALGTQNVFLGNSSANFLFATGSAVRNTFAGSSTAPLLTTSQDNALIGSSAGLALGSGGGNTLLGFEAGVDLSSEFENVVLGGEGTIGADNFIALYCGRNVTTDPVIHNYPGNDGSGDNNLFLCERAGNFTLDSTQALRNYSLGNSSLNALTTGHDNVGVGKGIMGRLTTGSYNVGMGADTFNDSSMAAGITTGNYNMAFGHVAGGGLRSSDSSNISFNNTNYDAPWTTPLSNTMVLGRDNGVLAAYLNAAYIHGIWGKTSTSGIAVVVNADGKLGTTTSSARYKQNIKDMEGFSKKLYELRPVTFNYRTEPTVDAFGLIAEEIDQQFPALCRYQKDGTPDAVAYNDLIPMLLQEIIELKKYLETLEAQLA